MLTGAWWNNGAAALVRWVRISEDDWGLLNDVGLDDFVRRPFDEPLSTGTARCEGDPDVVGAVKALPHEFKMFLIEARDEDAGRSVRAAVMLGIRSAADLYAAVDGEMKARAR